MRTTPAGSLRGTRPTICSTSTTRQSRRAWMARIQISPRPKRPPRPLNDAGLTTARKRLFSLCVGSADERSVCNRLWIQALGYKYSGLTRPGGPCAPATPSCFCLICVQAKPQLWNCRQGSLHWRNCVQRCGSHLACVGRRRQQRGDPTSVSLGPSAIADGNGKPRLAYAHLSVLRTLRAQDPSLPPPTHSFRCPAAKQTRIFVQVGWEEERLWRKGYTWAGIMGLGWLPIIGCMALWCAASGGTR